MNPEILKLIDFAVIDNAISPKDIEVIRKKAEKLGEDPDEVEMILNAQLIIKKEKQQTDTSAPPPMQKPPPVQVKKNHKRGIIERCPACGFEVKSMELNCSECGHEYVNSNKLNSLTELKKKLEEIYQESMNSSTNKSKNSNQGLEPTENGMLMALSLQNQGNFIRTHSFENTKEELIEHLTYSLAQIKSLNHEIADISVRIGTDLENNDDKQLFSSFNFLVNAWEAMSEQCITKAKLFIKDEQELNRILSITDEKNKSQIEKSILKETYPTGQVKSQGEFEVSFIDGLKKELPIGIHKSWYSNGNMKEQRHFDDKGVLHGMQKEWHENGNLKREFHCDNGLFEGMLKAWYSNGELFGEVYYKASSKYGPSRNWYDNGQIKLKRVFINQKMNGIATSWYENGEMMFQELYKDDIHVSGVYYNENGEETSPDYVKPHAEKVLESINNIS